MCLFVCLLVLMCVYMRIYVYLYLYLYLHMSISTAMSVSTSKMCVCAPVRLFDVIVMMLCCVVVCAVSRSLPLSLSLCISRSLSVSLSLSLLLPLLARWLSVCGTVNLYLYEREYHRTSRSTVSAGLISCPIEKVRLRYCRRDRTIAGAEFPNSAIA